MGGRSSKRIKTSSEGDFENVCSSSAPSSAPAPLSSILPIITIAAHLKLVDTPASTHLQHQPQPSSSPLRHKSAPSVLIKHDSNDSIESDTNTDHLQNASTSRDPIVPPPPTPPSSDTTPVNRIKYEDEDDVIVVSPVKPPQCDPPKLKPSKEDIEARKQAALKRLEATKLAKMEAQTKQLTEALRAERDKKRRELAVKSLGAFGFTVKSEKDPGVSRYGTGRGGIAEPVPTISGPLGDLGFQVAAPVPKEWTPNPQCSNEQLKVLEQVKAGKKVFFTGSAGVGKSFLLSEITRLLEHIKRPYQVCATTGIAALQVNGTTIHSWAGIGLGKDPLVALYDRIMSKKDKRENWLFTHTLIIDEISMMDPSLFTKLSLLGKLIRKDPRPFGGIQIVVSGDFFQLPPVPDKNPVCMRCGHETFKTVKPENSRLAYEDVPAGAEKPEIKKCSDAFIKGKEKKNGCDFEFRNYRFAFECPAWAECDFQVMELTRVYRQSDLDFIKTLEKFRRGICDQECVDLLNSCGSALPEGVIKPTNLYPLRVSVDQENTAEFLKLQAEKYVFDALDASRGPRGKTLQKERLRDVPGQEKILLKKGAQVMLQTNLDIERGLVNGSRGVIVDWVPMDQVDANPTAEGGDQQPPSQKKGPAKPVRGGNFGGEEWREQAANEWEDHQPKSMLPLVFFACGISRVIGAHTWVIDVDRDNTIARTQLPLQLAWALTIHKSQGQSLDAVKVQLTSTFEKGQAYVALSRCRTPAGMKVVGFKPNLVMAHPTVMTFYDLIAKAEPFRTTTIVPQNPLVFMPDDSPLLWSLARIFGNAPKDLPIGSALSPTQVEEATKKANANVLRGPIMDDFGYNERKPLPWDHALGTGQTLTPPPPPGALLHHPNPQPGPPLILGAQAVAFHAVQPCSVAVNWGDSWNSLLEKAFEAYKAQTGDDERSVQRFVEAAKRLAESSEAGAGTQVVKEETEEEDKKFLL